MYTEMLQNYNMAAVYGFKELRILYGFLRNKLRHIF